jgi:hypothetical protein
MNLKLFLASVYLPRFVQIRALEHISARTTRALDQLLEEHAPARLERIRAVESRSGKGIEERRVAMAKGHNARVAALLDSLGRTEGIALARQRLYEVGLDMGTVERHRLGIYGDTDEVLRAAKLMYQVLGIHFDIRLEGDRPTMIVDRCSLAEHYHADTCMVLSAADEGMFKGLNPAGRLSFQERMTSGAEHCVALIDMGSSRKVED